MTWTTVLGRAELQPQGLVLRDQPPDRAGGHAEKMFLLPNPFYRIP
jgi:hypothetical protein